jgi:hypothetical protein
MRSELYGGEFHQMVEQSKEVSYKFRNRGLLLMALSHRQLGCLLAGAMSACPRRGRRARTIVDGDFRYIRLRLRRAGFHTLVPECRSLMSATQNRLESGLSLRRVQVEVTRLQVCLLAE